MQPCWLDVRAWCRRHDDRRRCHDETAKRPLEDLPPWSSILVRRPTRQLLDVSAPTSFYAVRERRHGPQKDTDLARKGEPGRSGRESAVARYPSNGVKEEGESSP